MITLAMHQADVTREGWTVADACNRLADAGADVVGLNCIRGPATMLPLLREIRAAVKTPMAALPVPYRTNEQRAVVPVAVRSALARRGAAGRFRRRSIPSPATASRSPSSDGSAGAGYPLPRGVLRRRPASHPRARRGRRQAPPASRYSADMSKHAFLGSHERIKQVQKDYARSSDVPAPQHHVAALTRARVCPPRRRAA